MQRFMWVARYSDGSYLCEFEPDGRENSFYSIDRSRLSEFGLVSGEKSCWIDCRTGIFFLNGLELRVRYVNDGSIYELMCQRGPYNDIIQFKTASVSLGLTRGSYTNSLDSQSIGWKAALVFENVVLYAKLVLYMPVNRSPEFLHIWLASHTDMNGVLECQAGRNIDCFRAPIKAGAAGEMRWVLA